MPIPSSREIAKLAPLVSRVNALEREVSALADSDFKEKTLGFRRALSQKLGGVDSTQKQNSIIFEFLDEILPYAFALVREASKRTVRLRHYDVQILGGIVLHQGKIAEMATGEGKTLVATLSAYLNAIAQKGVHIVTVNDYLAKRDREWMGPIYDFLGLSIGVIQQDMPPSLRQRAYGSDITYGTNNEFGFDYLRDNMVIAAQNMVQRDLFYCIIDEVDSILVDEARTPLIISGATDTSTEKYYEADKIARRL